MLEAAIIGPGPYGLSVASHFRNRGIKFRIFGRAMDTWLAHMPKGMLLKSDGFASNLYDPEGRFTLGKFCASRGIEYADTGVPVRLETFTAYAQAFQEQMSLTVEANLVSHVEPCRDGFLLRLDSGETLKARRVVVAAGVTHFAYTPEQLTHLSPEFLSHSSLHRELEPFRGSEVAILGGGSSALDLAGLLHSSGASVTLFSRKPELKFHSKPSGKHRSWWKRLRHPESGLGPGVRSRFFANAPHAFHYLPEPLRLLAVRRTLGPSGGWFSKDLVVGKVPLLLGHHLTRAEVRSGRVQIQLVGADGQARKIEAQHLIAATGYRVNLSRLAFFSETIRSTIKAVNATPVLSSNFESSIPGLYFVGIAAANSFGPVMRFAFGAGFAARRVTEALTKTPIGIPAKAPSNSLVTGAD